jgi:hypothetical protein
MRRHHFALIKRVAEEEVFMQPRMSQKEYDLFLSFVEKADIYAEFGTGGSTFVASTKVKTRILSVDSSVEWLELVRNACRDSPLKPDLHFVDIGPTGDWGAPIDPATKPRWPNYHEAIWKIPEASKADLYMIDGRFRVACFAQVILRCTPDAILCFHDFASRPQYHRVQELAEEIVSVEDISFFRPRRDARELATRVLDEYRFNPE